MRRSAPPYASRSTLYASQRSAVIDLKQTCHRFWLLGNWVVIVALLGACNRQSSQLPETVIPPTPSALTGGGIVQPEHIDMRFDSAANTVILSGNGTLTLPELAAQLKSAPAPTPVLTETVKGEWLLGANLQIGPGVTLKIGGPDVRWLKLRSDAGGFVFIKALGGALMIVETKITSWDAAENNVDVSLDDGRSFVLARSGGRMNKIGRASCRERVSPRV